MSAIGHAHLDTAWLWPLEETWRKLVRTTTTQLRLMDAYPEHRFAHSQAQHYAWLAERAPALFARVREAVARGQWIPVGAMWVEPDCNLPSGESLARQLLYGQRWFEEHLGRRCTELWLPDVFGYAAQLPQLMRLAGLDRFLTQKLSWNRFTSPESHTFTWQGLDGSEVLTHFPPADTYNAEATVPELRGAATAYKDHPRSRHSLLVFGHGDGGGGPTAEMLERLRRMRDLAGLPETRLRPPDAFFDDLAADARDLRTVVGELYFEYHRGTYTSQAAVKRGNRRGERALQDAETLDALYGDGRGKAELDRLWRVLLLNQFHDILPGSSITEVYERARADLEGVVAGADAVAARVLGPAGDVPVSVGGPARRAVVARPDGRLVLAELPACGAGRVVAEPDDRVAARRETTARSCSRTRTCARWSDPTGGCAASCSWRRGARRSRRPGTPSSSTRTIRSRGTRGTSTRRTSSSSRAACGGGDRGDPPEPLRAEVAFEVAVGRALAAAAGGAAGCGRAAARAPHGGRLARGPQAAQGRLPARRARRRGDLRGHLRRGPAADALLHRPRPRPLRGPRPPLGRPRRARLRRRAAHGLHVRLQRPRRHAPALAPARAAAARPGGRPRPPRVRLRDPPARGHVAGRGRGGGGGGVQRPRALGVRTEPGAWVTVEGGLVLQTVKRAEDGDGLVLRLYEPHGGRGTATVALDRPARSALRADLLEEATGAAEVRDGAIVVPFRPWEIVTLRVDVGERGAFR